MLKRVVFAVLLGVLIVGPRVAPHQHILKAQITWEGVCGCTDGRPVPGEYGPGGHIEGFYAGGGSDHLTNSLENAGWVGPGNCEQVSAQCKSLCDNWLGQWNAQACSGHGFVRTIRWGKYWAPCMPSGDLTTVDSSC